MKLRRDIGGKMEFAQPISANEIHAEKVLKNTKDCVLSHEPITTSLKKRLEMGLFIYTSCYDKISLNRSPPVSVGQ